MGDFKGFDQQKILEVVTDLNYGSYSLRLVLFEKILKYSLTSLKW